MTNYPPDGYPTGYEPPEVIDELPEHVEMVYREREGKFFFRCKPCGFQYLSYDEAEDCHPDGLGDSPRRCAECGRIELVHKGGERNGSYRCYVCYSGTPETDAPENPFPDYDGVGDDDPFSNYNGAGFQERVDWIRKRL